MHHMLNSIFADKLWTLLGSAVLLSLSGCSEPGGSAGESGEAAAPAEATATIAAVAQDPREPRIWQIPNIPEAAEAYYAPDSLYVIAQVLAGPYRWLTDGATILNS